MVELVMESMVLERVDPFVLGVEVDLCLMEWDVKGVIMIKCFILSNLHKK